MSKPKPEKALETVLYVPNNDEGHAFIKTMRRFLNRRYWKMRVRGRGPRKSQGSRKDFLALRLSDYFGIYLDNPTACARDEKYRQELYGRIVSMAKELDAMNKLGLTQFTTLEKEVRAIQISLSSRRKITLE